MYEPMSLQLRVMFVNTDRLLIDGHAIIEPCHAKAVGFWTPEAQQLLEKIDFKVAITVLTLIYCATFIT